MNTIEIAVKNPYILTALVLRELVWKGLALWKSARQNQKYWFIALLLINTVGIFPIIYLPTNRKTTDL